MRRSLATALFLGLTAVLVPAQAAGSVTTVHQTFAVSGAASPEGSFSGSGRPTSLVASQVVSPTTTQVLVRYEYTAEAGSGSGLQFAAGDSLGACAPADGSSLKRVALAGSGHYVNSVRLSCAFPAVPGYRPEIVGNLSIPAGSSLRGRLINITITAAA